MRIVPDSTITLYAGVEISEGEQLAFSSRANQALYFNTKQVLVVNNCTMNKKNGRLRVPGSFALISTCNYMSFINPSMDNKVVFGRIVDYFYINNECCEIVYVIDYFQTWCFDVTFKESYIEREHLSEEDYQKSITNPYDPTIYEFKTLESLPVGKDIEKPYYNFNGGDGIYCASTIENELGLDSSVGTLLIFSGVSLKNADNSVVSSTAPSAVLLEKLLKCVYGSVTWNGLTVTASTKQDTMSFFRITEALSTYFNAAYTINVGQYGLALTEMGDKWGNLSLSGAALMPLSNNRINTPVSYVYIDGSDSRHDKLISELLNWFIDNSCEEAILGLYPISNGMIAFSSTIVDPDTDERGAIAVSLNTAASQQVENTKLDLYPFAYYRILNPAGDTCEVRIENFKSAQDGDASCTFGLCLDITETPNLLVAPKDYEIQNASPYNSSSNLNLRAGMVFSQFPTLPYATDSFRSQIASVANNIIGNNTIDYNYELQQKQLDVKRQDVNTLFNAIDAIKSVGNSEYVGAAKGFMNTAFDVQQTEISANRYANELNMRNEAERVLSGNNDNAIYNNFKYTKPAYACNEYHQINGDGVINFNNFSFEDIIIMRVAMNPVILQQYDKYFSRFGYTSGRCGIVRVVNFMNGSTSDDELPHWSIVDGKEATYVKTHNLRVDNAMLPVSQAIEQLFNQGCLFYKGDDIPQ